MRCPSPGSEPASSLELVALAGAQDQRRAALGERLGDRPPEAAGGPGEQAVLPAELHVGSYQRCQTNRLGPAMKLYVCWGTFQTPRPGGHPCAQRLRGASDAGHDPEVVKVHGLGVGPKRSCTDDRRPPRGREADRAARTVPVLVTDSGEVDRRLEADRRVGRGASGVDRHHRLSAERKAGRWSHSASAKSRGFDPGFHDYKWYAAGAGVGRPLRPAQHRPVPVQARVCANQHEIMSRSLQFDVELCTLPQLDNR